jgi:hypothetical protein
MWHEVIILTARWLPFLYWTFWNYILNFFGVLYWLFFLCISTFCFLYYTLFGFYIILFSVFILNLFFIYSFLFYIMIFWKSLLYWKSGGFGLPYFISTFFLYYTLFGFYITLFSVFIFFSVLYNDILKNSIILKKWRFWASISWNHVLFSLMEQICGNINVSYRTIT